MPQPGDGPRIIRFGPFELDRRSGELRKSGLRVGLQDQPLQILIVLLESPGELVTRDELRQRLWPADTYVDFEHGLNAAVKRLRDALGDSADAPQFVETVPRRGYRFVPSADWNVTPPSGSQRRRRHWVAIGIGGALASILVAVTLLAVNRAPTAGPPAKRMLTRLTFESGLQAEPTWSPDGRFIAYSSDQTGNFDIWVRPVAGGDAVQVTKDAAHDSQPDWSPDGSQIAFRSEREGGGLFLVRALGGEERRLTTFGTVPRWSPDGTRILFAHTNHPGGLPEETYIVGREGGAPRRVLHRVLGGFVARSKAIWHPDGRISVLGVHRDQGLTSWTMPSEGGDPIKSEPTAKVKEAIAALSLDIGYVERFAWAPSGRAQFFTGISRGVRNIWKVGVDPQTLRWNSGPERVTTGPGSDSDLALSRDGRTVAFVTANRNARTWMFHFDPRTGSIKGDGEPMTPPESNAFAPDLTLDGRKLLFQTEQPGREHRHYLIEKVVKQGPELQLAVNDLERGEWRGSCRWSPDGTRICCLYCARGLQRAPADRRCTIRILETATGKEQLLTSPAAGSGPDPAAGSGPGLPWGWSADGRSILATGSRYGPRGVQQGWGLALLPLSAAPDADRKPQVVTSDACHGLYQAAHSPNGQWIAFLAAPHTDARLATIYVINRSGGAWIQLTQGIHWDDKPRWAPAGDALYFVSSRGGVYNVWGIRFDSTRGQPIGDAFQVTSFAAPRRMILPDMASMEMAVGPDRLVLPLVDATGAIWMLEDVDR